MIELAVPDMSCNHCASTIARVVREVDAHGRVEVDLDAKRVRIDTQRPAAEFIAAITGAGYTPALAGAGP
jgi:copper chaperone